MNNGTLNDVLQCKSEIYHEVAMKNVDLDLELDVEQFLAWILNATSQH